MACVVSCHVMQCDVMVMSCTTPVLPRTTKYYSNTTPYYKYYSVLLQYYPVLQSTTQVLLCTTPVLPCTTKYYSSANLYYEELHSYDSVLQSTTEYRITYETSCTMRGATKSSLQLQQILPLPRKMNLMIDPHRI